MIAPGSTMSSTPSRAQQIRTIRRNSALVIVFSLTFLLIACGPPSAPAIETNALATRIAANIFATQTASVPTATNTIVVELATASPTAVVPLLPTSPSIGQRTKTSGCVAANALPDAACTPGAIFPDATTSQICVPGYSASVRNVPDSVKNQAYAEYGITSHAPGQYEVDHLISLELGGSNEIANLWPEPADPRPGFHEKDQVENYLHDQICSGAMSLQEAQVLIATNWLAAYSGLPAPNADAMVQTATPSMAQSTSTAAPQSGLDIHVVSLTSPIQHGKIAALTIQTAPGASCRITVLYKSGPSKAKGLDPKTADSSGQCSWMWTVGTNTTPGTWSISVSASLDGQTKSLSIPFVVQ